MRRRRARERWRAMCGRQGRRAQGSLTLGSDERICSAQDEPGQGRGDCLVCPAWVADPEGRTVTHRTAAAMALLAAPAIQLWRRAPSRVCPARPGRPAPRREPPPARSHVTRDPSGTRRAARCGVAGSGSRGALPLRDHGGPELPPHFRSGTTERDGRKWETRGHRAQPGWAGRRRWPHRDRERPGGWACGSGRRFFCRAAVPAASARGRARLPGSQRPAAPAPVPGGRMAAALQL